MGSTWNASRASNSELDEDSAIYGSAAYEPLGMDIELSSRSIVPRGTNVFQAMAPTGGTR